MMTTQLLLSKTSTTMRMMCRLSITTSSSRGRIISSTSTSSSARRLLWNNASPSFASSQQSDDCRVIPTTASITTSSPLRQGRPRFFSSSYGGDDDDDDDYNDDGDGATTPRTALVLGSSGALGSTVARYLSQDVGIQVLGADVKDLPSDFSPDGWDLDGFVPLPERTNLSDLTVRLVQGVEFFLQTDDASLDAIVVASGGWMGDPSWDAITYDQETNHKDPEAEMEERARQYAETIETMRLQNLDPVCAAGFVAQQFMSPNGLMVVLGATAALSPTPGMLGYGLAKTASHHLVQTLGAVTGKSMESKALRKTARKLRRRNPTLDSLSVVAILPTTIDTPNNRQAMPQGKFDQWTRPKDIAKEIGAWMDTPELRPHSGSLVKVYPKKEGPGASFELVR